MVYAGDVSLDFPFKLQLFWVSCLVEFVANGKWNNYKMRGCCPACSYWQVVII